MNLKMKGLFVTLTFLLVIIRVQSNIVLLGRMIHQATKRSIADYIGYGNYCGPGGSGTPVDPIDNCCKTHDECYYSINRDECKLYLRTGAYIAPYFYTFENGKITCSPLNPKCSQADCTCDKNLVDDFAENNNSYNASNKKTIVEDITSLNFA